MVQAGAAKGSRRLDYTPQGGVQAKRGAEDKEVAERYGLNLNEIVQGGGQKQGSTKRKVPPKFRHPDDSSKTWTGRGRKPKWVQAWEDEGGSIEDLRITESEATE